MARITRVDQHVPVAALEQDVVRRQPVADENMQLRRQRGGWTGRSKSIAGCCCHPTGNASMAVSKAYIVPAARNTTTRSRVWQEYAVGITAPASKRCATTCRDGPTPACAPR